MAFLWRSVDACRRVVMWSTTMMLFSSGLAIAQQDERIIDLTNYRPESQAPGTPVNITVVTPNPPLRTSNDERPAELTVPSLQLIVESATVSDESDRPILNVGVRIHNVGEDSFFLPVSLDESAILDPRNRGRRKLIFSVVFEVYDTEEQGRPVPAVTTTGSESVSDSLIELRPGESALVRLPVNAFSHLDWVAEGPGREANVRVTVREVLLQDVTDPNDTRQIAREAAGELGSENVMRIQWP